LERFERFAIAVKVREEAFCPKLYKLELFLGQVRLRKVLDKDFVDCLHALWVSRGIPHHEIRHNNVIAELLVVR
jgi:hypothetical protein